MVIGSRRRRPRTGPYSDSSTDSLRPCGPGRSRPHPRNPRPYSRRSPRHGSTWSHRSREHNRTLPHRHRRRQWSSRGKNRCRHRRMQPSTRPMALFARPMALFHCCLWVFALLEFCCTVGHLLYSLGLTWTELLHDTKTFVAHRLRFRHLHLPIFVFVIIAHRLCIHIVCRHYQQSCSCAAPRFHSSDGRRRPACDPGWGWVMVSFC